VCIERGRERGDGGGEVIDHFSNSERGGRVLVMFCRWFGRVEGVIALDFLMEKVV
jgi:hypothetical protein